MQPVYGLVYGQDHGRFLAPQLCNDHAPEAGAAAGMGAAGIGMAAGMGGGAGAAAGIAGPGSGRYWVHAYAL